MPHDFISSFVRNLHALKDSRSNILINAKSLHALLTSFNSLSGVLKDMEVPESSWCQGVKRIHRKLHKKFLQNQTGGSMLNGNFFKIQFFGSKFSQLTFVQILLIQSMEKDIVLQNPKFKHLKEHFLHSCSL